MTIERNVRTPTAICLALAAASLVAGEGVLAQAGEEITVVAPRDVTRKEVRSPTGGRVEKVSLTRHVSIADLDLTLQAAVMELDKRIDKMAQEACDQLGKMYPDSTTSMQVCVREAVTGAKRERDEAVAAAAKKKP